MSRPSFIKVGVILSAHGVRGEVKIRSLIEPPPKIFSCGALTDASGLRIFTLKRRGGSGATFIASLEGITDRNVAESLRATELFAPAGKLPKKKKGQWYFSELKGLEARLASGKKYGRVVELYNFGAGDIVEIELAKDKKEMLPLKKPFVTDVQPEKGYLIVSPPEYIEEEKK